MAEQPGNTTRNVLIGGVAVLATAGVATLYARKNKEPTIEEENLPNREFCLRPLMADENHDTEYDVFFKDYYQ